jgi:hypothetical protein
MADKANLPIPVQKALRKLGQDISDARRRRRIPTPLMAAACGHGAGNAGQDRKR